MIIGIRREDKVRHRPVAIRIKSLYGAMVNEENNAIGILLDEKRRSSSSGEVCRERAVARLGAIHRKGMFIHVEGHNHILAFVIGERDDTCLFTAHLQFHYSDVTELLCYLSLDSQAFRRR